MASEPDLAARVTGARLVGERRWDVYLDGRVEVRLPAERPEAAWRRLAAEQRASGVLARAITAIDLRNPDWLTVQIPDAALEPAKGARRMSGRGRPPGAVWSAAGPGAAAAPSACSTSAPASSAATSPAPAGRGVQLLGRGYQLAEGLKAGEIVDAEAAETAILAVLHEAEQQAGETLREIVLAVSGGRPQSSYVRVTCQLHGRAVAEADLQLLLDRARRAADARARGPARAPARGHDRRRAVRSRMRCGLSGERLEVVAHLVTVAGPALRNVLACLERCHIEVKGVVWRATPPASPACRGRDGARLPRPRPGRRHHRARPLRRRPADAGRARCPMAATT